MWKDRRQYDRADARRARFATEERTPDRLPRAIFHRDAHGKGDMAKKTKKPPAAGDARARLDDAIQRLEDGQVERAVERATRWARLADQLEGLLDRAESLFRFGIPLDSREVEAEFRKLHAEDPENFPTIGDVRKMLEGEELGGLFHDLGLAANWLAMLRAEGRDASPDPILDVQARLDGAPLDPTATPADALARSIVAVRKLLEADLARARSFAGKPGAEDLDVLRRLRDEPKTAKVLAVEIAGKGNPHNVDEKRVERAIERLKKRHGFDLPNVRGSGYSLSPSDRKRLDELDGGT